MDDQPLREFLAEAEERIETLFADIERLRHVHSEADGRVRRELVARIFRHVHTLKGSASTLPQLAPVSRLAHEFENLLDAIRAGRAPLTDALVDTCEDATNAFALILECVARGDGAAPPEPSPSILKQLRQHGAGSLQTPVAAETNQRARAAVAALPAEIARALSVVERQQLSESVKEGARVMLLAAAFDLATLDQRFPRCTAALGDCGEIISTFPGDPANAPDQITFQFLYTTNSRRAELEARLAPFGARIAWAGDAASLNDDADIDTTGEAASTIVNKVYLPDEKSDEASVAAESSGKDVASRSPVLVRVPLHELDELVTATHELFNDTLALIEQAPASATPARVDAATHTERAKRLREDFSALEERVMRLRMQPLLPVLERAARSARIAARTAGKEIELEVAGGEVHVDRSLAEQVGEPLLHLLHNAIDHGIETKEERRAAGKPLRGRVRLEVAAEGSRVRVRVTDDGRGIETERVARVAIAQGLLAAGTPITHERALRLIFRPGFSTVEKVSAVSGRGVGLDVVEHALERAGGELRVRSASGVGTTFELRVPLALALVSVVLVRANEYVYAFDARHVVETGYLKGSGLIPVDPQRCGALWRGRQLSLVSLTALLGHAQTTDTSAEFPIIIARRERTGADGWRNESEPEEFIIAVDKIDGEREALVRSLGRHATRWRGVSGAFAQRDGTVALLLDLPGLLERVTAAGDERG